MANDARALPGRSPNRSPSRCSCWPTLLFAACLVSGLQTCVATAAEIVTWAGNTPSWNERLGVTLMRQGCDATPAECLKRMRASAKSQRVDRWALAIKRDAGQWPADALEYSRHSLAEPLLVEVDVDDFLSALKSWHAGTFGRANRVLADIIRNLKLYNPSLRFGITLYEDEINSQFIAWIPAETRERVDRVSLYLHYRANARDFARYVADVRGLFPKAQVWAGSYAYDRIDYLSCAQSDKRPCRKDEEIALFRDSLRVQLDLLNEGAIAGIEFYPGFFGKEDQWHGWGKERICRLERRSDCIENTKQMRETVRDEFAKRHVTGGSINRDRP